MSNDPLMGVRDYYTAKLADHGTNPRGVDWNSHDGQVTRFARLATALDGLGSPTSVLDVGCGYGALLDHLEETNWRGEYVGYDIAPAMTVEAQRLHPEREFATTFPDRTFDVVMASGIFNVRLDTPHDVWEALVLDTIEAMHRHAVRGFAFNMLTSYSDRDRMRPDLYYGEPTRYFTLCMERLSRNVALLHDYRLYEFTIVVRK